MKRRDASGRSLTQPANNPQFMNQSNAREPQPPAGRPATEDRTALLAAFRATFSTEHGKRVLGYLDASAAYGKPSFLPPALGQPYDPIAAAIRDGRKSVLAEIHEALAIPEDGGEGKEPRPII